MVLWVVNKLAFLFPSPSVFFLSPRPPPLTVASFLRCIHSLPSSSSLDFHKESEDLRTLLPKGFELIGVVASGEDSNARVAVDAAHSLRKLLYREGKDRPLIGAICGSDSSDLRFFVSESGNAISLEVVPSVIEELDSEKCLWENACLLCRELSIKLPLYYALKNPTDRFTLFSRFFCLGKRFVRNATFGEKASRVNTLFDIVICGFGFGLCPVFRVAWGSRK
ncbi:Ufm1-specific protease [Vigna angularis]|uniref:Ufm1-specific protease n=1 Tax=Phaseolus angularis TaxID=3914 RepID=A0A8T0L493_PHAAN|nr:Ufm1-specific protease [Vigna angularis]